MKYANPVSRSAQRGFSLLEVLIAAVVLAAGLLALTALQGALMRNSADAKARSQLAALAQSVMDEARSSGYGAIPVGGLTVITFHNNHLVYAITWYSLALMLAGGTAYVIRQEWRARRLP